MDINVDPDVEEDDEIDVDRILSTIKYTSNDQEVGFSPSGTKYVLSFKQSLLDGKHIADILVAPSGRGSVELKTAQTSQQPKGRTSCSYNTKAVKKERLKSEHTFLKCGGEYAKLGYCGLIVHQNGMVIDQYVRVCSKLYEKVWEKQFGDHSRRFMLDPLVCVDGERTPFCVGPEELCIWPLRDIHSCGIHMLMAIKRNAQSFITEMEEVSDMAYERAWLLCEDVMSEFNEARAYVQELIKDLCV
uniref:Uncharacterized protein n=1 Tax=Chenopodium quinoa TaxID=63459 RepID=A0A803MS06_CHEQI